MLLIYPVCTAVDMDCGQDAILQRWCFGIDYFVITGNTVPMPTENVSYTSYGNTLSSSQLLTSKLALHFSKVT